MVYSRPPEGKCVYGWTNKKDGCSHNGYFGNDYGRYCGTHWFLVRGFYKKVRKGIKNLIRTNTTHGALGVT